MAAPPKIIHKGGTDTGSKVGESRDFTRTEYFILENVPLPIFTISRHVPRPGSFHPRWPVYVAGDSAITNNIELPIEGGGRGVSVTTTYKLLNTGNVPDSPEELAKWLSEVLPWNLPAQDYKTGTIRIDESMDFLYRYGVWEDTDLRDPLNCDIQKDDDDKPKRDIDGGWLWDEKNSNSADRERPDVTRVRWRMKPFENAAGTKITGTRQRSLLSVSFYYYVYGPLFQEEYQVEYGNAVNDADITIAGRRYKRGQVQIADLNAESLEWEHPDGQKYKYWKVAVQLHIDPKTWLREYENAGIIFKDYILGWDPQTNKPYSARWDAQSQRPKQTEDDLHDDVDRAYFDEDDKPLPTLGIQKIYTTQYDPTPDKIKDKDGGQPILLQNAGRFVPYFGTREKCWEKNRENTTEVTEPMLLNQYGCLIWPNPKTGLQSRAPHRPVTGFPSEPKNFDLLRMPERR